MLILWGRASCRCSIPAMTKEVLCLAAINSYSQRTIVSAACLPSSSDLAILRLHLLAQTGSPGLG